MQLFYFYSRVKAKADRYELFLSLSAIFNSYQDNIKIHVPTYRA